MINSWCVTNLHNVIWFLVPALTVALFIFTSLSCLHPLCYCMRVMPPVTCLVHSEFVYLNPLVSPWLRSFLSYNVHCQAVVTSISFFRFLSFLAPKTRLSCFDLAPVFLYFFWLWIIVLWCCCVPCSQCFWLMLRIWTIIHILPLVNNMWFSASASCYLYTHIATCWIRESHMYTMWCEMHGSAVQKNASL